MTPQKGPEGITRRENPRQKFWVSRQIRNMTVAVGILAGTAACGERPEDQYDTADANSDIDQYAAAEAGVVIHEDTSNCQAEGDVWCTEGDITPFEEVNEPLPNPDFEFQE